MQLLWLKEHAIIRATRYREGKHEHDSITAYYYCNVSVFSWINRNRENNLVDEHRNVGDRSVP